MRGVKLSISSPRASSAGRVCGGTSRLFIDGAIESSTINDRQPEVSNEENTTRVRTRSTRGRTMLGEIEKVGKFLGGAVGVP